MKRRLTAAALILCLTLPVCACSSGEQNERKTVINNAVSRQSNISLVTSEFSLKTGEEHVLSILSDGVAVPTEKYSDYAFSSSDESIVTVDGRGKMTARQIGRANIDIVSKIYPGVKVTAMVSVIPDNQAVSEASDENAEKLSFAQKFAKERLNTVAFDYDHASSKARESFTSEYEKYNNLIDSAKTPEEAKGYGEEGVRELEALVRRMSMGTESSAPESSVAESSVSNQQSSSLNESSTYDYSTYSFSSSEEHFAPYTVEGTEKARYYLSNIRMTDGVASHLTRSEVYFLLNVLAAMKGRVFEKDGELDEFFGGFEWYRSIPEKNKIDPEKVGGAKKAGDIIEGLMTSVEAYNNKRLLALSESFSD